MKRKGVYTVSNGKLVLHLRVAEEGGFLVTSPFDPQMVMEAETLEEALANARDAKEGLRQARRKLSRPLLAASKKD